MKVTAFVADDEPVARAGLRHMLNAIDWLTCIGEATHGQEAVERINHLRPELVLLDIQMPGLLGTDVLRRLEYQPVVIFTTAFAQHAVTAFELGAVDYLLKPFGAERLAAALDRVRGAFGEPGAGSPFDRLAESLGQGPIGRLFVRTGRAIVPISVNSISRFEADGDYVAAHVGRSRYLVHLSLSRLETRLDPAKFLRIHRAHIVNLDHVTSFKRLAKGRLVAELDDATRLEVSRSRARDIRELGS